MRVVTNLFALKLLGLSLAAVFSVFVDREARADLRFKAGETPNKARFVLIAGDFEPSDQLQEFEKLLRTHSPSFVTFNSMGGNIAKAIEVGKLIRRYGVDTIQIRELACASACALAFLGGVRRFAEAGSIGVHKSSFSSGSGLSVNEAVSAVQSMTALTMSYIGEMGADPLLLQLALKYDADDIRYLSKSEMRQYRVTSEERNEQTNNNQTTGTTGSTGPIAVERFTPLSVPSKPSEVATIEPRTGRVRHPKGQVGLKISPDQSGTDLIALQNGFPISILSTDNAWYKVQAGPTVGYLHSTWVRVDQFHPSKFDDRYIQIKSLPTLAEVKEYARSSPLEIAAFLTPNGWFAITLKDSMAVDQAQLLVEKLKAQGRVPNDAFVTYGNAYMSLACCK